MSGPRLVIIGLPGAGKTTVGALLAQHLDVSLRDTDSDIESTAGMSISDIFVTEGEEHFRTLERAAVTRALAEHHGVLALGGGAILDPDTRADLAGRTVVYLKVSLAAASPRIGLSSARPLLIGSPRKQWLTLAQARQALYQQVATIAVDTDDLTAEQVAQQVMLQLDGAHRGQR